MNIRRYPFLAAALLGLICIGAGCAKNNPSDTQSLSPRNNQRAQGNAVGVTINPDRGSPLFTSEEVAIHATSTDCWVIVNKRVYDVTDKLKASPAKQSLATSCGKEAAPDLATEFSASSSEAIGIVQ